MSGNGQSYRDQFFSGMDYYEHRLPCDATQIGRFRTVVCEAGLEQMLKATIDTAVGIKAIKPAELERVIVDTTVQRDSRWRFLRGDNEVEEVVAGRYTLNHSEMRLAAIELGLGVGCAQDFVARDALAAGRVVRLLPVGIRYQLLRHGVHALCHVSLHHSQDARADRSLGGRAAACAPAAFFDLT